jgi:hypothetical protein
MIMATRDGMGNTRPLAPDHNPMLNDLCNEPVDHAPSTFLPTSVHAYRKLGAHLAAVELQPIRCCFNCGMLNYPTRGDTIVVKAQAHADLRAWRVYEPVIEAFCEEKHLEPSEVFLCDEHDARGELLPTHVDGSPQRRVYSCSACKREAHQDPRKYDLFDGHTQMPITARGWRYDGNGVGEPMPDALAQLTSDERLAMGIVKMADAAFEQAYSGAGYVRARSASRIQACLHSLRVRARNSRCAPPASLLLAESLLQRRPPSAR